MFGSNFTPDGSCSGFTEEKLMTDQTIRESYFAFCHETGQDPYSITPVPYGLWERMGKLHRTARLLFDHILDLQDLDKDDFCTPPRTDLELAKHLDRSEVAIKRARNELVNQNIIAQRDYQDPDRHIMNARIFTVIYPRSPNGSPPGGGVIKEAYLGSSATGNNQSEALRQIAA